MMSRLSTHRLFPPRRQCQSTIASSASGCFQQKLKQMMPNPCYRSSRTRVEWSPLWSLLSYILLQSSRSCVVHSLHIPSSSSPPTPSIATVQNGTIRRHFGSLVRTHPSTGSTMHFSSLVDTRQYQHQRHTDDVDDTQHYDETKIQDSRSSSSSSSRKTEEKTILICGDGDLSFGASFATRLAEVTQKRTDGLASDDHCDNDDVRLIVSVLESEIDHTSLYRNSVKNVQTIRDHGHEVLFGLDATDISRSFNVNNNDDRDSDEMSSSPENRCRLFHRIQFHFPHCRGKTNIRKNRELLQSFFRSSKKHLTPNGEIHLALRNRQGGMHSETMGEWKQSWKPAQYAAEHGLLLSNMLPYQPNYNLSAYQWKDLSFDAGPSPQMYVFTNCSEEKEEEDTYDCGDRETKVDTQSTTLIKALPAIQLYSFFNILVALPAPSPPDDSDNHRGNNSNDDDNNDGGWTRENILDPNVIQDFVRSHVPVGIRTEAVLNKILDGNDRQRPPPAPLSQEDDNTNGNGNRDNVYNVSYAVYQIRLFGEGRPLTQNIAETYRLELEQELLRKGGEGNRQARWFASNVHPSSMFGTVRPLGT